MRMHGELLYRSSAFTFVFVFFAYLIEEIVTLNIYAEFEVRYLILLCVLIIIISMDWLIEKFYKGPDKVFNYFRCWLYIGSKFEKMEADYKIFGKLLKRFNLFLHIYR